MSTALRIASVTQVLKDLLDNGLIDHDITGQTGGEVIVTNWPPDKIDTAPGKELSQLNLFMYQVTYNQGWRNVALPSFNQKGERVTNPPLALDLHYLLTAYGSAELHTDILLGYGMQLFHETPVLDRDAIRRAIGPPSVMAGGNTVTNLPDSLKLLSASELAEQIEQIRITPETLSIEDISKLWAAFGTKYRPTAAYKATVVLIESSKSTKPALPVKARNIYVKPFRQPVINKILSQSAIGQPVLEDQQVQPGFRLVLEGELFTSDHVEVDIDGQTISSVAANLTVSDTLLSFDLPAALSAGVHEVQVVHPIAMGNESPPALHKGAVSSSKAFILSPVITAVTGVNVTSGSGTQPRSATIGLKVKPAIDPGQRVMILLNELPGSGTANSYSFPLSAADFGSPPQPLQDISVKINGVKAGSYLLRIQVDGAESPLKNDAQGNYNSPSCTIV